MTAPRALLAFLCLIPAWTLAETTGRADRRPNVILIMTDDQGYGDVGAHGNPRIKTPHMDQLAREGVRFQSFYVSPLCFPTRASLMTGRDQYRSGMFSGAFGHAMIHTDEVTIAEPLRAAGYRTAVFGKWQLGDNYPMRPMDQGFEMSLVHRGGAVGSEFYPAPTNYFDPLLERNGKLVRRKGYITDILTDAAIAFIEKHRTEPFFVYVPYNVPHTPLLVPEKYLTPYREMKLKPGDFPAVGWPLENLAWDTELRYAMITNADENIGRILARLDELALSENTMVMFLSDNGVVGKPWTEGNPPPRYNAGMRGVKTRLYEGGIRSPLFVRWPARIKAGRTVDRIAAHIDLLPTILEACGVALPGGLEVDGLSLLPLLTGQAPEWPDRTLHIQWDPRPQPVRRQAFSARSQNYKLVRSHQVRPRPAADPDKAPLELYDMRTDPLEMKDIAGRHPEIVEAMLASYDTWFEDVTSERDGSNIRIVVGTPHQNPAMLTFHDHRKAETHPWNNWGEAGHWPLAVGVEGVYRISLRFFEKAGTGRVAVLKLQGGEHRIDVSPGTDRCAFPLVSLRTSPAEDLEAWTENADGTARKDARLVFVERVQE